MSDRLFYISASQLGTFFQCPARYAFTRQYVSLDEDPWWLRDGTIAHKIMAGQEYENSARAVRMAGMAQEYLQRKKYEILGNEIKQLIRLTSVIRLQRTIDVLAVDGDGPVLLDFKFTGKAWDQTPEGIAPKATGFQSQCYLIEPDDPAPFNKWPERIHFIVVDEDRVEMYPYTRRPDDLREIRQAAAMMKKSWDKQWLPKVRGHLCARYCEMRRVCFQEEGEFGWRYFYDPISNDPYKPDVRYEKEIE